MWHLRVTEAKLSWMNTKLKTVFKTTPLAIKTKADFGPTGVSVTPDGAHIYVVSGLSDSVWVIDTATNQVLVGDTIPVGDDPAALGQFLGSVSCATQNLFEDDPAAVEQMRRVRDEQLSAPAGAFLSEVLARHSADLIGMLADHPELRDESRELLLEAARVAQEGARFDDELIDRVDRHADARKYYYRTDVRHSGRDADDPRVASGAHARGRDRKGKRDNHAPVSAVTPTTTPT